MRVYELMEKLSKQPAGNIVKFYTTISASEFEESESLDEDVKAIRYRVKEIEEAQNITCLYGEMEREV